MSGTGLVDGEKGERRTGRGEPATTRAGRHPLRGIAFRFRVGYLGLFCLFFTPIPLGFIARRAGRAGEPWAFSTGPVTGWVGRTVFGADAVPRPDSGAGDQTAAWVLVFCILVVAAVAAAVWTAFDRRPAHPGLAAWFTLFLRLCLGAQLLSYGFAKLIPTQMPPPALAQLLERYGDLSPASVLWLQVGSAPAYQVALGAVEVVGGLLLFVPRTAVLGAVVSSASMAQVFLTNLTYDVPEKLLSAHLLLIGLVLLAPYLRRLADVFVRQRACEPLTQPPLFADGRKNRVALWAQVALGLWLALGSGSDRWTIWQDHYGPGSPRSELYGIWDVRDFAVDGQPVPPLTTDGSRWQRLVFDAPGSATYQRMNGELVPVRADVRPGGRLELAAAADTGAGSPPPFATLRAERPAPDRLVLRGTLRDHAVAIVLDRVDPDGFTLRSRGFHWVQDYPYFR